MHHITYSSTRPLDFTVELCTSCHFKLHRSLRRFNVTPEFLELRYLKEHKSLATIAQEVGCSASYIQSKLREYKIPIRQRPVFIPRELLEDEYVQRRDLKEVAKELQVHICTLRRKLKKYGIPLRPRKPCLPWNKGKWKLSVNRQQLENENGSLQQLCAKYGVTEKTMRKYLRAFNLYKPALRGVAK